MQNRIVTYHSIKQVIPVTFEKSVLGACKGYRYSFQSQEHDDEIKGQGNSINYKYRMHDPRLGRFFAIDPLTKDYPWNSPYAFSENVVINAVELEGLEKSYTFNSAELSSQALTVIKTQSYSEVKKYMDNLVGTPFENATKLKEAQDKLGSEFEDSPGYSGDGRTTLSYGNRAVRGGYEPNSKDYFYVRLVIDNGNGTWSTQNLKVTDYAGRIKKIDNELESVGKKIASNKAQIAQLDENNRIIAETDLGASSGSFRAVRGKVGVDYEEMSYKAGQVGMMLIREAKIKNLKAENLIMEDKQKTLESRKTTLESKKSIEVID